MAEKKKALGPRDLPHTPDSVFELPAPLAAFLEPPGGDSRDFERSYFDPPRWDAEMVNRQEADERDPVAHGLGRCEGRARAALIVSDFHMADGTAGGDDFLDSHLTA